MRECPVKERCLARDSCSRNLNLRNTMTSAMAANTYQIVVVIGVSSLPSRRRTLLQTNDSEMTTRALIARIVQQEDINFLLTNRIPRRLLTQFVGWLSRIEQPWVCAGCIALWRLFSDLDLSEAKKTHFKSVHECFTRELKDGARPIDQRADILVSPCDAIVGACGAIAGTRLYQAKGFPY